MSFISRPNCISKKKILDRIRGGVPPATSPCSAQAPAAPGSISCLLSLRTGGYCCFFFFLLSPPDHLNLPPTSSRGSFASPVRGGLGARGVKIRFLLRSSGQRLVFWSGLFVATGTCGLFLHSDFGLCCEFAVISRRFAVGRNIFVSCKHQSGGNSSSGSRELLGGEIWLEGLVLAPIFL